MIWEGGGRPEMSMGGTSKRKAVEKRDELEQSIITHT